MLRPFMADVPFTAWDRHIPAVQFAFNSSIQASLKVKPYSLMFGGREPILPIDIELKLPSSSLTVECMAGTFDIVMKKAQENLVKAQAKQKEYFDRSHINRECQIGDLVICEVPITKVGESSKLQPLGKVPYKIIEKINDLAYRIEDARTDKVNPKREIVSARRLRPFQSHSELQQENAGVQTLGTGRNENSQSEASPVRMPAHPVQVRAELPGEISQGGEEAQSSETRAHEPPMRQSSRIKARRAAGLLNRNYLFDY
jgi:hypothetical protein